MPTGSGGEIPVADGHWGEDGPSWALVGAGGALAPGADIAKFLVAAGGGAFFKTDLYR